MRVLAILIWSHIFLFLNKYGVDFTEAQKDTIHIATTLVLSSLLYAAVTQLPERFPKYFWWLGYIFVIPTNPVYEAKKGDE